MDQEVEGRGGGVVAQEGLSESTWNHYIKIR